MLVRLFRWKNIFTLAALLVVVASLFLSQYISTKLQEQEKKNVEFWAKSTMTLYSSKTDDDATLELMFEIIQSNNNIPVILTDKDTVIIANKNFDSLAVANDPNYLSHKIREFQKEHEPLVLTLDEGGKKIINYVFYGDSRMIKLLRYYPYIQICLIVIIIMVLVIVITNEYRSTQNKLWLGMSKETAHQLGTPLTSLQGWLALLSESHPEMVEVGEMQSDLNRLNLVVDRFSNIGSKPKLSESSINDLLEEMVTYMQKRISKNISISLRMPNEEVTGAVNPNLFNWVIENLIRNAADSMEKSGSIKVTMYEEPNRIIIDVSDTGSGISSKNLSKIFNPGFTTKQRGWGIGLSLTKRIINDFHKGEIFVKESHPGKGTTFRIILKKQSVDDIRSKK